MNPLNDHRRPTGSIPPKADIRLYTTGSGGQPIVPRLPGRCRYSVDGDSLSRSATSATEMPFTFSMALAAVTSASTSAGTLIDARLCYH